MPKRIYKVSVSVNDKTESFLVRSTTRSKAKKIVADMSMTSNVASQDDLVRLAVTKQVIEESEKEG